MSASSCEARIRAISAHGRMTGMALSSIPAAVAAIMFVVNPDYVTFFVKDEIGNLMALAGIGLQISDTRLSRRL